MSPPTPSEPASGKPAPSSDAAPSAERAPGAPPGPSADVLRGRHVVLCVTGGIAAYKSAYLVRALVKAGAQVVVVMSEAAQRFVAPLTFETLSGNRVVTSTFERVFEMGAVEHIDLATWADVVVVAPATYNFLGKVYAGIADDTVSTFMSAVTCPVFIAPAMNEHMWRNPINQRNVAALRELGYRCIDPERGGLACSWEGDGRMREPDDILDIVCGELPALLPSTTRPDEPANPGARRNPGGPASSSVPTHREAHASTSRSGTSHSSTPNPGASHRGAALAGRTVLITAAGTWEAIDPVRFIGNRSSGRMGYALARAARRRGARVLLISGPSALSVPEGLAGFRSVETAEQMRAACHEWMPQTDVLFMAAAVADYRPSQAAKSKIRRGGKTLEMTLEPTPDVLASLRDAKEQRLFVGFALETDDPQRAAQDKLAAKGLDLIVANRVGDATGPNTDTNQVWIYNAAGLVEETPLLDKAAIAEIILDIVEREMTQREQHATT